MYRLAAVMVTALLVVPTIAGTGPFSPVPKDHWAYAAFDQLQKDGIVVGYPSGVLAESKEMTRYEFAVATARVAYMLWPDVVQSGAIAGQKDKQAQKPELKPTNEDLKIIQKLTDEFRDEMAALGVDVDLLKLRLSQQTAREQPVEKEVIRGRLVSEPSPFSDVPKGHWAYDAVNELQQDGILIGYPDGTFGGRRTMARYEFAVAVAKMISIIAEEATALAQSDDPAKVRPAYYFTKSDCEKIRRLVGEFRDELTSLGVDVDALKRELAALDDRIGVLEKVAARDCGRADADEIMRIIAASAEAPKKPAQPQEKPAMSAFRQRVVDLSARSSGGIQMGLYGVSPFQIVPTDHWAYQALGCLQKHGFLTGYPDQAFSGKVRFTQLGLTVALTRALPQVRKEAAIPDVFFSPERSAFCLEDAEALRKLVDEFRDELTALDCDVDQLKRDVATVNDRLAVGVKEVTR